MTKTIRECITGLSKAFNATISMKREASNKIVNAHPSIFSKDERFKYLNDEDKMRKLYGLK